MLQAPAFTRRTGTDIQEEIAVTFQVALVGCDGLVVGSDKRQVYFSCATENDPGAAQPSTVSKFKRGKDDELVCAYAGGDISEDIALVITKECIPCASEIEWKTNLRTLANKAADGRYSERDQVIVVRKDSRKSCWMISRTGQTVTISEVKDAKCTGLNLPAMFLPRHFWRPNSSVDKLRTLALLTLSYAEQENPSGVGSGFDIMTLRADRGEPDWKHYDSTDAMVQRVHDDFANGCRALVERVLAECGGKHRR